jgi:hypothetical protein
MGCSISQVDFGVIRGTTFSIEISLTESYDEVLETPSDWRVDLVFREEQDDNLPSLLTLTTTPVVDDPGPGEEASAYVVLTASAAETQALPEWDIVAYCELVFTGEGAPTSAPITRLFNSDVSMSD